MKRLVGVLCMSTALVVAGTISSVAQESRVLKRIKERGVINMGHREASVPFSYLGPDNKPIGYSIDVCDHIATAVKRRLGRVCPKGVRNLRPIKREAFGQGLGVNEILELVVWEHYELIDHGTRESLFEEHRLALEVT